MSDMNTQTILARLEKAHGAVRWKCFGKAVDVLVETILSQNTSDANSSAGYRKLRQKFRSWNQVADAPVGEVEDCIRISGLAQTKAPRIQAILREIRRQRGKIDLQFLAEFTPEQANAYLRSFKGVGPKTAQCTLLFSLGMPVFPVDTHIHRIAMRLGLISPSCSADMAHDLLLPMIAPENRYAMHILLITHGRRVCKAQNPQCEWCCLLSMCPHGKNHELRFASRELKSSKRQE